MVVFWVAHPCSLYWVYKIEADVDDKNDGDVDDDNNNMLECHCIDACAAPVECKIDDGDVSAIKKRGIRCCKFPFCLLKCLSDIR